MIYAGVIIGVIIMAVMVTMAVRKKSDKNLRIAALIALGVMILSVIICVIVIFSDTTVAVDPSQLIVGAEPEVKEKGGGSFGIIILVILLLILFVIVAIVSMREAKKYKPDDGKSISIW